MKTKNRPENGFKLTAIRSFKAFMPKQKLNQLYGDYVKQRKNPNDKSFEIYLKYLLFWNENKWLKYYAKNGKEKIR
jgi:hypothetical protein